MRKRSAVLGCLLLAGCPAPITTDAESPDGGVDAASADALGSDAPGGLSLPGGPCASDADCLVGTCLLEAGIGVAGGICQLRCDSAAECPSPMICSNFACRPACTSDAECRDGFRCYDAGGDGQLGCAPAGVGSGGTGAACRTQLDCAGGERGRCLRFEDGSGMCSDGCDFDADCVAGGHCSSLDGSLLCFADCTSDTDCADGLVCDLATSDRVTECFPRFNPGGAAPGEVCSMAAQCRGRGSAACITEPSTTFGICTQLCAPPQTCDATEHCATVIGIDGAVQFQVCLPECTSDDDCADGFGCTDEDGDGVRECYFSGVGDTALGQPCGDVSECGGGERAVCVHRASGAGYCTIDCRTEACDAGSECLSIGGGRMCFPSCTEDSECAEGLRCRPSAGGMACQA